MKRAGVVVSPKAASSIRRGTPWVYRTELAKPPRGVEGGDIVEVLDVQQTSLGQAFWAASSPIALRLLTRKPPKELTVDEAFFRARLEGAWRRRSSLHARDAFRVVHGESDGVPGLLVDRYGTSLTLQTLAEGADRRKESLARALADVTGAQQIVCRDDSSGRDFEGLPREKRVLMGGADTTVRYHEGPNVFAVDLLEDAKTGGFLDQVDNHLRASELATGTALDTFSYHGGFALALARRCTHVTAVEQDEKAAAQCRANVAANGLSNVTVEQANAFDVLRGLSEQGRTFDVVVVDPPGLAKRKEGVATALRAYRELNVRAFKLVAPDGLLVTCSCSGKVTRAMFDELVLEAASDAKRTVQVLERRGPGIDHPALPSLPQSEYLKAWFLRVL